MRALLALVTAVAIGCTEVRSEEAVAPELHGIWFCTSVNGHPSYRALRTVLMMRGNEFLLVTSTGMTKSSATTNESNIDIVRYEGKSQQGIFRIEANHLWMTLADPGGARPTHMGHKKGEVQIVNPPHSHFHFQRSPTIEGLAMLRAALNDEAKREQLESPHSVALDH